MSTWVPVTQQQARQHRLYGIRGWAIALVAVLVLTAMWAWASPTTFDRQLEEVARVLAPNRRGTTAEVREAQTTRATVD